MSGREFSISYYLTKRGYCTNLGGWKLIERPKGTRSNLTGINWNTSVCMVYNNLSRWWLCWPIDRSGRSMSGHSARYLYRCPLRRYIEGSRWESRHSPCPHRQTRDRYRCDLVSGGHDRRGNNRCSPTTATSRPAALSTQQIIITDCLDILSLYRILHADSVCKYYEQRVC